MARGAAVIARTAPRSRWSRASSSFTGTSGCVRSIGGPLGYLLRLAALLPRGGRTPGWRVAASEGLAAGARRAVGAACARPVAPGPPDLRCSAKRDTRFLLGGRSHEDTRRSRHAGDCLEGIAARLVGGSAASGGLTWRRRMPAPAGSSPQKFGSGSPSWCRKPAIAASRCASSNRSASPSPRPATGRRAACRAVRGGCAIALVEPERSGTSLRARPMRRCSRKGRTPSWICSIATLDRPRRRRRARKPPRKRAGAHRASARDRALEASARAATCRGSSAGAQRLVLSSGFSASRRGLRLRRFPSCPWWRTREAKKRRGHYWTGQSAIFWAGADGASSGDGAAERTLAAARAAQGRDLVRAPAWLRYRRPRRARCVSSFIGCVLGGAVWRRSSYLAEREGSSCASPLVDIVDDPLIPRGPGSRAFDGEGSASRQQRGGGGRRAPDLPARQLLRRASWASGSRTASAGRSGGGVERRHQQPDHAGGRGRRPEELIGHRRAARASS